MGMREWNNKLKNGWKKMIYLGWKAVFGHAKKVIFNPKNNSLVP
jgi:hypothetical protein